MPDRVNPELVILYFVDRAENDLPVTKLMKLVFLADVEHQQLYGEPLTDIPWTYHHYGALSQAVYDSLSSLQFEGFIEVTRQQAYDGMGKTFRSAQDAGTQVQDRLACLGPRATRAMAKVLEQYGNLQVWQIKQVSYQTATMKGAVQNERLDLSREPRCGGAVQVPGVAQFLADAPEPTPRDVGDPELSAQEDLQILEEMETLRQSANRLGR